MSRSLSEGPPRCSPPPQAARKPAEPAAEEEAGAGEEAAARERVADDLRRGPGIRAGRGRHERIIADIRAREGQPAGSAGSRGARLPPLPAAGRVAGALRRRPAAALRRGGLLGEAAGGFRRPGAPGSIVVGLAPAAHGGNRTGRFFTGDRSGDWLFAAMHRAGYANQPLSERRGDGLRLRDAYVTAVNRCPPPQNRPTTDERDNCLPFLERELELLGKGAGPRRPRQLRLGRRPAGGPFERRRGAASEAALRPRRRGARRALLAARLLPPEPAEHLHRQAHRGDARRGLLPGAASSPLGRVARR